MARAKVDDASTLFKVEATPIPELLRAELEELQFPAPVPALRALAGIARGQPIPAERMGRMLAYEREKYLRDKRPPRLAVGLAADGTPASPAFLGLGSWRLARRLIVPDAEVGQAAALGVRICERAMRIDLDHASRLHDAARQATRVVLGPEAAGRPLDRLDDWSELRFELLAARPAGGMIGITVMQHEAEARLLKLEIPGVAQYFGAQAPLRSAHVGGRLRLPLAGEAGEPFDDVVRRRAGDGERAREVLAFVQEWGHVADELPRAVTVEDYVHLWDVNQREAARRLELFRAVLPGEEDPSAVWSLLWDGVQVRQGSIGFVRLTSVPVVDTAELPDLAGYFLTSLREQASVRVGRRLAAPVAAPDAPPDGQVLDPEGDLRRLLAVTDLAVRSWVKASFVSRDVSSELAVGVLDGPPIDSPKQAEEVERALGTLRHSLPPGALQRIVRGAQRCARVGASLSLVDPPRVSAALLPGVQWAAATLAAAAAIAAVDPVEEAREALRVLAR
jgi:hypothetical protein